MYLPSWSNSWRRWLPSSATQTWPAGSTATASGCLNCPLPVPSVPNWRTSVSPDSLISTTRLCLQSATQTLPPRPTGIPVGSIAPSPVGLTTLTNSPFSFSSSIRSLKVSETQMLPLASIARCWGRLNCPFPDPSEPTAFRNSPFSLNSSSLSAPESATQKLPAAVKAIDLGSLNWPLPVPE